MGKQRNGEGVMTDIDKIYWSFMCAVSFVVLALAISLVGCVGPIQGQPDATCRPLSAAPPDRASDPCELEYWENQQFTNRGGG